MKLPVRRGPLLRLSLLALILVAAAATVVSEAPSLAGIERVVRDAGAAGPILFVLLYVALTVALVPGTASTLASGLLFGPVGGVAYALCGATIGATVAFAIGRALGRDGVRQLLGSRAPRIEGALDETGFVAMLVLRLLPIVPFNGLNYAAGVTGIGPGRYVAATALGIAPGTTAVAVAGSSVTHPTSPAFLASVAAGTAILVASLVVHRRRRRAPASPAP